MKNFIHKNWMDILCALTIVVIIMYGLNLIALYANQNEVASNNSTYEQICVNIDYGDGCCYMLYADVSVNYDDGEVSNIVINNPELLAYDVTEKYEGGLYVIDYEYLEKMFEDVRYMRKLLMETPNNPALHCIDSLYNFCMEGIIITNSST